MGRGKRSLSQRSSTVDMNNDTASAISQRGGKRSRSRHSSTVDTNNDGTSATSQKISLSLLNYRLVALDRARIVVQHRGLPAHIQSLVDAIIQPQITEQRKSALFAIADGLCDEFTDSREVASREDGFVEQIERALEAIDSKLAGQVFTRRRKAGT